MKMDFLLGFDSINIYSTLNLRLGFCNLPCFKRVVYM